MTAAIASIGAMVYETTLDGFDHTLGRVADAGYDHAELSVTASGVVVGGALSRPRMAAIEPLLARRRLAYTAHAPLALNFMDADNAALHRAVGRACVEFCAAVGARVLVVHPAWVHPARLAADWDGLLAREREALADLANVAAGHGVTLCLENMPVVTEQLAGTLDNHGCDPRSVAAQVAAVAHPHLAATLDVSHACLAAAHTGGDAAATMTALAPWVRHLHLHDSFARPPTVPRANSQEAIAFGVGDTHLPLGWGTIDWEGLLPGLPIPPGATITLEIIGLYADAPTLADSLARARRIAELMERESDGGEARDTTAAASPVPAYP